MNKQLTRCCSMKTYTNYLCVLLSIYLNVYIPDSSWAKVLTVFLVNVELRACKWILICLRRYIWNQELASANHWTYSFVAWQCFTLKLSGIELMNSWRILGRWRTMSTSKFCFEILFKNVFINFLWALSKSGIFTLIWVGKVWFLEEWTRLSISNDVWQLRLRLWSRFHFVLLMGVHMFDELTYRIVVLMGVSRSKITC